MEVRVSGSPQRRVLRLVQFSIPDDQRVSSALFSEDVEELTAEYWGISTVLTGCQSAFAWAGSERTEISDSAALLHVQCWHSPRATEMA